MEESQLELYEEHKKFRDKLQQERPELFGTFTAFRDNVYQDGALSRKIKHLLAMAVGLRAGCPDCIAGHTRLAVEAGASKAEVVEAVSVAVLMGGSPANAWAWRVVKTMEEMGKW